MKYRCLIVDDEAPAHKVLTAHILQVNELELVSSAFNGQEALTFLQNNQIDIVFLDVEMPKLSGLDLLDCLPYKPIVILTTAYNNFGFEAYQKDVLDYLLKPVSYARFLKSVNKALQLLSKKTELNRYAEIELKQDGVLKKINSEHIIYIESIGNYVKIFFLNDKPLVVQQTLKYIESQLTGNYFIRIHKSFLVKKSAVVSSSKTEVILSTNKSLPLGRRYAILLESLN